MLKAYSESGGKHAGDIGEFNDQLEHRWVWSSYVFLSHVYGQQSECLQSFREHICNNVKFHGYRLFRGWGRRRGCYLQGNGGLYTVVETPT